MGTRRTTFSSTLPILQVLVALAIVLSSAGAYAADTAPAAGPAIVRRPAASQVTVARPPVLQPVVTSLAGPSAFDQLKADLSNLAAASGARVGISLQELSGRGRNTVSLGGGQSFYAASAYKLPLLMAEAAQIAAGQVSGSDVLCWVESDDEDGWFADYGSGACFTRNELAIRAGRYSDNTAAHILVRDLGGPDALNRYARSVGMSASALWDPNTTTPDDLAAAWVRDVTGQAGGAAASAWLQPLLTHTAFEQGIPAGLPGGAKAVHKVGDMYGTQNDSAFVSNGEVAYVLAVCVDGLSEAAGWSLIASISARVWTYEAGRPLPSSPTLPVPVRPLPDRRH